MVVLVGILDGARCFSAQMSLQQAASRALERVQVSGARTNFDYVRTEAANAAGVPPGQVTVTSWAECNNNPAQLAYTTVCPSGQPTARYVQVRITSTYTPYFRFSPLGTRDGNGNVALAAQSSVRVQ